MPQPRQRATTAALPPKLREVLESRGARSDKGRGPTNLAAQVARTLEIYDSLLIESDPRRTQGMPKDQYELIVEALTEPLALEDFHIARLGEYLFERRAFRDSARERRLDPQRLRDTLNGYPYAEKLHLVDAAQVRHAPPPAVAEAPRARRRRS